MHPADEVARSIRQNPSVRSINNPARVLEPLPPVSSCMCPGYLASWFRDIRPYFHYDTLEFQHETACSRLRNIPPCWLAICGLVILDQCCEAGFSLGCCNQQPLVIAMDNMVRQMASRLGRPLHFSDIILLFIRSAILNSVAVHQLNQCTNPAPASQNLVAETISGLPPLLGASMVYVSQSTSQSGDLRHHLAPFPHLIQTYLAGQQPTELLTLIVHQNDQDTVSVIYQSNQHLVIMQLPELTVQYFENLEQLLETIQSRSEDQNGEDENIYIVRIFIRRQTG